MWPLKSCKLLVIRDTLIEWYGMKISFSLFSLKISIVSGRELDLLQRFHKIYREKREFKVDLGVENSPATYSLNKPFIFTVKIPFVVFPVRNKETRLSGFVWQYILELVALNNNNVTMLNKPNVTSGFFKWVQMSEIRELATLSLIKVLCFDKQWVLKGSLSAMECQQYHLRSSKHTRVMQDWLW